MPPVEHPLLARIEESDLALIVQLRLQTARVDALYCVAQLGPPWAEIGAPSRTAISYSSGEPFCRAAGRCPSNRLWVKRAQWISAFPLPICRDERRCPSNRRRGPRRLAAALPEFSSGTGHWLSRVGWQRHRQPPRSAPAPCGAEPRA